MVMLAVACWLPQVTRTLPVPGLVLAVMRQVQVALPSGPAVAGPRPAALLVFPAGVV